MDCLQLSIFCLFLWKFHTAIENRDEAGFFIGSVTPSCLGKPRNTLCLLSSPLYIRRGVQVIAWVAGSEKYSTLVFHRPYTLSRFTRRALNSVYASLRTYEMSTCSKSSRVRLAGCLSCFPRLRRESVDSLLNYTHVYPDEFLTRLIYLHN